MENKYITNEYEIGNLIQLEEKVKKYSPMQWGEPTSTKLMFFNQDTQRVYMILHTEGHGAYVVIENAEDSKFSTKDLPHSFTKEHRTKPTDKGILIHYFEEDVDALVMINQMPKDDQQQTQQMYYEKRKLDIKEIVTKNLKHYYPKMDIKI